MSSATDNEYLQHAQIIQGVLIFLSACTSVIGYVVQSRLAQAAHRRELDIARRERHLDAKLLKMRTLLKTSLGPMQSLLQEAQNAILCLCISLSGASGLMEYFSQHVLKGDKELMFKIFRNETMTMRSRPFLTDSIFEEIKAKPEGHIAKAYRTTMTVALNRYWVPAADLIGEHMNELPFPSREEFKKKFPELKDDPQLRKVLLLQMANWVHMMQHIVNTEWSRGDYTNIFPPHIKYPNACMNYLIWMLDELKFKIEQATSGITSYNNVNQEEEFEDLKKAVKRKKSSERVAESKSEGSGEIKEGASKTTRLSKATKYAIGTVAGAAGGAVATTILGTGTK